MENGGGRTGFSGEAGRAAPASVQSPGGGGGPSPSGLGNASSKGVGLEEGGFLSKLCLLGALLL